MNTLSNKTDSFAHVLAKWLAGQGATPREAAPVLGVSHMAIYRWLHGGLPPSTRIPALAALMGVDRAALCATVAAARRKRSGKHITRKIARRSTVHAGKSTKAGVA